MNQNLRVEDDPDVYTIVVSDVEDYIMDEGINLAETKKSSFGFGFHA